LCETYQHCTGTGTGTPSMPPPVFLFLCNTTVTSHEPVPVLMDMMF
jgi:hypothetical protein